MRAWLVERAETLKGIAVLIIIILYVIITLVRGSNQR